MKNILELAFEIDGYTKSTIYAIQNFDLNNLKKIKNEKRRNFKKLPSRIITEDRWRIFFNNFENVEYIKEDFFKKPVVENDQRFVFLENSLMFISSTPPQAGGDVNTLANFYNISIRLHNTIISVWDWDNHHHLHISSLLSSVSDIYFNSHKAHNFELSMFCDCSSRLPLSSHQWSDESIADFLPMILENNRMHDVGGRFVQYDLFSLRNKNIKNLSKKFQNINLIDDSKSYFKKTPLDKLNDWLNFKCQWIIPTLNDVSTRVFDALITGNVVILHARFRNDECLKDLHVDDCVFYFDDDIYDPLPVVELALKKFDECGKLGILRRVNYGMANNLDKRFSEALSFISLKYISA